MKPNRKAHVFAVLRSREAEAHVRKAFAKLDCARLETRVADLINCDASLDDINGAEVLLLDVGFDGPQEMGAINEIVGYHADRVTVVASSANPTVDGVRQLMRFGVADFLPQPIKGDELVAMIEAAMRKRRARRSPMSSSSTVISFVGTRGGMGTTTIAVQMACNLLGRGKSKARVCVLDLDFQFGSTGLYLDISGGSGMLEITSSPESIDGSFLRGTMCHHKSGLDVLVAPASVLPLDVVTPEIVAKLIAVAREEYEYVIIDLACVWTTWKHQALVDSDHIVFVTQLSVPAIREARRQLDTLRDQGVDDGAVLVVLNRYVKDWGSRFRVKQAEKALGRPISHFVANDYKSVFLALDHGVPLSEIKSGTRFEKQIRKIITDLAGVRPGEKRRIEPVIDK